MSVSETRRTPEASSLARSSSAFSMIPLWTTATLPAASRWGWAFGSLGSPWVAQRVWAIPTVAVLPAPTWRRRSDTRPATLVTLSRPRWTTARPAES